MTKEKEIWRTGWLLALTTCFAALYTYLEYNYWAGFPDGFLSELARAEKILFSSFSCLSILFGIFFFRMAWHAQKTSRKALYGTAIFYLVIVIAVYLVDFYLQSHLRDAAGG